MKNVFKVLGIIALVAVIGFGFVSCDGDDDGGGDKNKDFTNGGAIINPSTDVYIGQELTARYLQGWQEPETVTFQWKKDGSNVGTASTTNPNTFTPTAPGSYTVTISAAGYKPSESSAVTVQPGITLPTTGVTTLTKDVYADCDGLVNVGDVQWFKFVATATTQTLIMSLGSSNTVKFELYNSSGVPVKVHGYGTTFSGSPTIANGNQNSFTATVGSTYYIKIMQYIGVPASGSYYSIKFF